VWRAYLKLLGDDLVIDMLLINYWCKPVIIAEIDYVTFCKDGFIICKRLAKTAFYFHKRANLLKKF